MEKSEIRPLYKAIRRNVSEREEKERAISDKLAAVAGSPKTVFCYESIVGEVSTADIIAYFEEFAEVYVPEVSGKDMLMRAHGKEGYTNKSPELTIVPLIAFDEDLYRVGFGGGYYDRFLANHPTNAIGIAFDEQQCEPFPTEATDIPLDMIITPTRILKK